MHRRPLGPFLQRYLHLIVLAVAVLGLLLLTPAARNLLYRQFDDVRSRITASLTEQLGRPFSYERLSPSVFRNLEIYGLEIEGPQGDTLRIDRARVSYSILAIIRGDVQEVVERLILHRAYLEIDFTRDRAFIENVRESLFGRGLFPEDLTISLQEVEIRLIRKGLTVGMTNIGGEVRLEDPNILVDLQSRVLLRGEQERPVQLESQVAVQLSTSRGFDNLDGEIALGRLFGTHLVLDPLSFDIAKSGERWSVTKQQDAQPFDLRVDASEGAVTVSAEMERFVPGEIIAPGPPMAELEPWLGSTLTGDAEIRVAEGRLAGYSANLEAYVPGGALPEPLDLEVNAEGNRKEVAVEALRLSDPRGGVARFGGSLYLDRLTAAGRLSFSSFSYAGSPAITGGAQLSLLNGRQGFSSAALTVAESTVYQLSGSLELRELFEDGDTPADFEIALSLNPERTGIVRGSGSIGSEGVVALDAQVEQVSLDELLDLLGSYDPRIARYAGSVPDGRYRLDTRLRLRRDEEGLFLRAPFVSLYDTEDYGTYLSLNLTYDRGTLVLQDIVGGSAGYEGSGRLFARVSSGGTMDFELDLDVEGIEYSLRGLYTPGDSFVFSGGHGVDGRVYQSRNGEILFSLRGVSIPVPLQEGTGSLTFRLEGRYASQSDWRVELRQIRLSGTRFLRTGSSGRLEIIGVAEPGGVTLSDITYEDPVSNLTGKGTVKWHSLIPPTVAINARLESTQGEERYEISGSYEEGDLAATLTAVRVPFLRLGLEGLRGGVDMNARVRGSPADPILTMSVRSNEAGIAAEELDFSGTLGYEERRLRLRSLAAEYSTYVLRAEDGVLDQENETLRLAFTLDNNALERERTLSGNVQVDYSLPELTEEPLLAVLEAQGVLRMEGFRALTSEDTGARELRVAYADNELTLSNWYREGFRLSYNRESGEVSGYAREPLAVEAMFEGIVEEGEIEATITEIDVSVASLMERFPSDRLLIESGELGGSMRILGELRDPDFFGTLRLRDVSMSLNPLGETIGPFDTSVVLDEKSVRTTRTVVPVGSGEATAEAELLLNRLALEGYRVAVTVAEDDAIPVDGLIGPVSTEGFASGRLNISGDTVGAALEGRVTAQSVRLALSPASERPDREARRNGPNLSVDLEIVSGRGVQFVWPNTEFPVLRSTLATQQEVAIGADRQADTFSLEGDVEMQSGDIFYFDRSFYIREGEISFDEDQDSFDPRVTVRAELREATPEGPVRIYLVANNELLSEFSPRFESSPPLSTAEIVGILGGSIFAQSPDGEVDASSALLATSDILTQFGVLREFEDNVRNALNLDLFSIRTQVFQNIVASAIEDGQRVTNEEGVSPQEPYPSLGSYLNNTSVFMGRYLGNELFLEMLVQLQADPAQNVPSMREDDIQSLGGVLIDPEIRLEWQTPFFLLEWSFAPNNPEELFIRDNVFTFSWGFSY
ncbi:MAG: translocation/assembly module TamB domain-containing protein [Spirochaetaceae bacterium]